MGAATHCHTLTPDTMRTTAACTVQGIGQESKRQRLQEFLHNELPRFEEIRGPTDRIQHTIRVKTGGPIKQRFGPGTRPCRQS